MQNNVILSRISSFTYGLARVKLTHGYDILIGLGWEETMGGLREDHVELVLTLTDSFRWSESIWPLFYSNLVNNLSVIVFIYSLHRSFNRRSNKFKLVKIFKTYLYVESALFNSWWAMIINNQYVSTLFKSLSTSVDID